MLNNEKNTVKHDLASNKKKFKKPLAMRMVIAIIMILVFSSISGCTGNSVGG